TTGAVLREGGRPRLDASLLEDKDKLDAQTPRASLAVVPVVLLVATILLVLVLRGTDASYDAVLYGAWLSLLAAVAMALACRALTLQTAMDACVHGFRAMALAIVVLVLAWSIGKVMGDLKAGEYVATLVRGNVPTWALPTITFVLAGLMAL